MVSENPRKVGLTTTSRRAPIWYVTLFFCQSYCAFTVVSNLNIKIGRIQGKYSGETNADGQPNGEGTFVRKDGAATYIGTYVHGFIGVNGLCKLIYYFIDFLSKGHWENSYEDIWIGEKKEDNWDGKVTAYAYERFFLSN